MLERLTFAHGIHVGLYGGLVEHREGSLRARV